MRWTDIVMITATKKNICFLLLLLLSGSCIPYSFAPDIEGTKLLKAKKFKSDLPGLNALVFKDTGEEYEFYRFLQKRLDLEQEGPLENIPVTLNEKTYYLSYYEREKATRTFNLLPVFIDALLEDNEIDPVMEENYTSRFGTWYIILTVTDDDGTDCLSEAYGERLLVVNFLRVLYHEYMNPLKELQVMQKPEHS